MTHYHESYSSGTSAVGSYEGDSGLAPGERLVLTQALERAADPEGQGVLLNYCAFWSRPKAVELMGYLGEGFATEDGNGDTALHWAARGGCPDTVRAAVYSGGDPHRQNHNGQTPLAAAALLRHTHAMAAMKEPPRKPPHRLNHNSASISRTLSGTQQWSSPGVRR